MKRSNTLNKTDRGVFEPQSKRIRTAATLRDKENGISMINNNVPVLNRDKSVRLGQIEKKISSNNVLRESQSGATANARCESTISFSSPAAASRNADPSILTNNSGKSQPNANESLSFVTHNHDVEILDENNTVSRSAINSYSQ